MNAPRPLLSLEEALARVATGAAPHAIAATETVSTFDALGRVLAQPVASTVDVPPLDNTSMDGYALRAADVPAAGGFLLTDFREQLGEILEVGKEVACYRDPGEIPLLVRFYLENESARREMAARARARVLAEHTYVHRLTRMLATIRGTV